MRYLLDANAVIALLNEPDGPVGRRVRSHEPYQIGLSAIAVHELFYGAFKSQRQERNVRLVDRLLFEVVSFDREDGRQAGEIRAQLARRGVSIGPYDVLIAGQARARDLTVVSANLSEFRRVDGLAVEDWSDGSANDA
jgi:tRNA(fMet)-specific endonuclease VapC